MADKIDLTGIERIYGKIIGVEEYWHPRLKWISMLPDDTDVRQNKMSTDLVKACIDAGARTIQFKFKNKQVSTAHFYLDIDVTEITTDK